AKVKKAYAAFLAAHQMLEMRKRLADTAQASAQLAQKQFDAGNVAELELVARQAVYEQLRLEVGTDQVELEKLRGELNTLLGLWGTRAEWKLVEGLEHLPPSDGDLAELESVAMAQRPDVEAARRQAALFHRAVDLARTSRAV